MTRAVLICLIAATVVADQLTKAAALSALSQGIAVPVFPGFNLTLGFNEGASFGMMGGVMAGKPLLMAALTGAPPPPLPPSSYVSALFDAYAPHFERHLTRKLNYRAPQLLADVLLPLLAGRRGRIADLGCGTGLMGRLLRGQASELDGVDLSPAMIEQAKACGVYDALDVGDLDPVADVAVAVVGLVAVIRNIDLLA